MRKKATYLGLGLAVALGLTATASSGLLPVTLFGASINAVAEGDDTAEEPSENQVPISTTPAADAEIGTDQQLSEINISFKRAVDIQRSCTGKVQIKKGDQVVQEFAATDVSAVTYGKAQYDLLLKIAPLTEPGEYTVTIPAGLVLVGDVSDTKPVLNVEYSFKFKVEKTFGYSVSPALGTQFAKIAEGQQFEVTFDGVDKIEIDRDIAEPDDLNNGAVLRNYTNASNFTVATSVTLKAEGNKLIVTADNEFSKAMTNLTNMHLNIFIPKGALKFTFGDQTSVSSAYNIGNYYTVALPQSMLVPERKPSAEVLVKPEDMTRMVFNYDPSLNVQAGSSFYFKAYLYQWDVENNKKANSVQYGEYELTVDAENHQVIAQMKPATATTVVKGNPHLWEKGMYAIEFPASALKTDAGNSILMDYQPYNVAGISTVAPEKTTPAAGSINPTEGINNVQFLFGGAMVATDQVIKVYKEGDEANPLFTCAANDNKYVVFTNSNKTITINFPIINAVGKYVVDIPEGAFRQTNVTALNNQAMKLVYTLPEVPATEITPAVGSYVQKLDVISVSFPGATKVELTETAKEDLKLYRGADKAGATVVNGYTIAGALNEENDKVIDLKFSKVCDVTNAMTYFIFVPADYWKVTVDGKTYTNPPITLTYKIDTMEPVTLSPAPGSVDVNAMKTIKVTPPEGITVTGQGKGIIKLFGAPAAGASLSTGASNTFGQYTLRVKTETVTDEEGNEKVVTTPITDADGSVYLDFNETANNLASIGTGDYLFRIANTGLTYADATGAAVTPKAPLDVTYSIAGLPSLDLQSSFSLNEEELPHEFYIFAEGATIGQYEGFERTWGLRRSNGTMYKCSVGEPTEDGRLKITIPDTEYDKMVKANLLGQTLTVVTYNGTTAGNDIAAGAVKIEKGGETYINAKQNMAFTYSGPITSPYIGYTPAAGIVKIAQYPAGIQSIVLKTDATVIMDLDWDSTAEGMVLSNGQVIDKFTTANFEKVSDNEEVLSLNLPIKESGKYTLVFPRGFFKFGKLATPSAEITLDYEVEGLEALAIESISPAKDAVIDQFTGITLNFKDVEIAEVEKLSSISYMVSDPLSAIGGPAQGFELVPVINPDKKSVLLTFSEEDEALLKETGRWPVTTPGNYTIVLDENALLIKTADGTSYGTSADNVTYSLIPETKTSFLPDGKNYVKELTTLEVVFDDMQKVAKYEFATGQVTLKKGDTEIPVTVSVEGNKLTATCDAQTAVGKYTLSIPDAYLVLTPKGDFVTPQLNRAITHDFEITAAPKLVSVSPTDGSEVDFFTNIDFIFSFEPSRNRNCDEPAVLKRDGQVIGSKTNKQVNYATALDNPNYVGITYSTTKITDPGVYTVEVPEGFFLVGGVPTEAITVKFIIAKPFTWGINPIPNSSVDEFKDIVLTFADVESIKVNKLSKNDEGTGIIGLFGVGDNGKTYYVKHETTNDAGETVTEGSIDIETEGNVVTLKCNIPASDLASGEYHLEFPKGAFDLTGDGRTIKSPYIMVNYYKCNVATPTIDPAPGDIYKDAFSGNITVTLQEGDTFDMWLPANSANLYKCDETGSPIKGSVTNFVYDFNKDGSAKGKNSVTLYNTKKDVELEVGSKYCLEFRKGTIMVTTEGYEIDEGVTSTTLVANCPFYFFYTVVDEAAVDSVFGDADSFNIYTVDGKIVVIGGTPEDVKGLEPGMYIINGKNVLIRK